MLDIRQLLFLALCLVIVTSSPLYKHISKPNHKLQRRSINSCYEGCGRVFYKCDLRCKYWSSVPYKQMRHCQKFKCPYIVVGAVILFGVCMTGAQKCATCGQDLGPSLSGCIESPVYNGSLSRGYPPDQNCDWTITFNYTYVHWMKFTIKKMDLDCEEDFVRVQYLGQDPGVPYRWCDMPNSENVSSPANSFKVNTNRATLKFHSGGDRSDGTRNLSGFQITYQAWCNDSDPPNTVDLNTTEIHPPLHNVLAQCKFSWRISEPGRVLLFTVVGMTDRTPTGVWRVSGEEAEHDINLSNYTCVPLSDVIVTYDPAKGLTEDTYLRFERGDRCGNDPCDSQPCKNGGTCAISGDSFKCVCLPLYSGDICEDHEDDQHCKTEEGFYSGNVIEWGNTAMGETDIQPCPNATGNATRPCLVVGTVCQWGQPDLSGCVSKLFADIYSNVMLLTSATQVDKLSILNITMAITSATSDLSRQPMFAGDLNTATNTLETVSSLLSKTQTDNNGWVEIAKGYGNAVGNIVDPITSAIWSFTHTGYLENCLTTLFKSMETLSANIASKSSENLSRKRRRMAVNRISSHTISAASANLEFEIRVFDRGSGVTSTSFSGKSPSSQITLPDLVYQRALQRTAESYIHIYNAKFTSVSELLQQTYKYVEQTNNSTTPVINSDILSSKVLNVNQDAFSSLNEPVRLVFSLQNSSLSMMLQQNCVFLNMSARTSENRWLNRGCRRSEYESNDSYTVCYCDHLTNFAVLMDIYGIEDSIDELNSKILTYLSYAGGALSILGCIISVIVFEFFRLKNERIRIHEQLALTIILVQIFFLVGIDRTENRQVCMAMAICLHFFLMGMFCWMLVEGIHLYLLLVKVFQSRSHLKKYIAIGWGVPLVVVGISAGIFHDAYGAGSICWLSRKVLLVAFVPAVGLVIVINTVVLLVVMRIMMTSLAKGSKLSTEEKSSVRIGLKAASVLLPLLGLTWTFGFLSITSKETLIFTYLFTLFNSTQGVFFFVFHCLLSVDVQNAYDRRSRRRSHQKLTEYSISKQHSRKNSYSADSSKNSTLMTEIAETLERRRSNRNSYSSIGRPQSVSFDDDVFVPNDISSSRGSVYSNGSGNRFRGTVHSAPMPDTDVLESNRKVLNNSIKSKGSVSSDGYLFYYGRDRNSLKSIDIQDLDKNQIYATVNK